MTDDEWWIMRPCVEGLCRYESLKDGSLDLIDISRMNEALDVRDENQARWDDAVKADSER